MHRRTNVFVLVAASTVLALAGCGGGGDGGTPAPGGGTPPPPSSSTFTIGGSVADLPNGMSVALENNGNAVTVMANGAFTFPQSQLAGSAYNVAVSMQPVSRNCSIANGSGTLSSASVTNVAVTCSLAHNWVTDGAVNDVVASADGRTIYVGGEFTRIGPRTGSFALIDTASASPDSGLPKVDGSVLASAPDGAGGWYIGGTFTLVGTRTPGATSHAFCLTAVSRPGPNPDADLDVYTLAVVGNTVYAGGNFFSIGGQSRNRIAALDAATGLATAWNPNASSTVLDLKVIGSTVYVVGAFGMVGGQTRFRVAGVGNVATCGSLRVGSERQCNRLFHRHLRRNSLSRGNVWNRWRAAAQRHCGVDLATGLATAGTLSFMETFRR